MFVNAGITNNPQETIGVVSTEEFVGVMVTNALSPMRVVEALDDLVAADGTVGVMSSGQGSEHAQAQFRGTARHRPRGHGDLGGPDARLSIEESVPNLVSTLLAARGETRPAVRRLSRSSGSLVGRGQLLRCPGVG